MVKGKRESEELEEETLDRVSRHERLSVPRLEGRPVEWRHARPYVDSRTSLASSVQSHDDKQLLSCCFC